MLASFPNLQPAFCPLPPLILPDLLGGDGSAGPRQRTGAVGEGDPAHPDDTLRGVLQLRWRIGSPWLIDCCDDEGEQFPLTFDLQ